jgi:hypothetical protein
VGINLWWARNDGIGGHAWLSDGDVSALDAEMRAQAIKWAHGRERVTPDEVDDALAVASPEPLTDIDPKLWADWLSFLEGARDNDGLVIR